MRKLILIPVLALAACKTVTPTVVRDEVHIAKVPVAQACVIDRPAAVKPINEQVTRAEWDKFTTAQKAAYVATQTFAHQEYGERLDAATHGCREAKP